MERVLPTLPNNVEALKALVTSLHQTTLEQQVKLAHQSTFIDQLLEQIKLARHKQYGAGSERWHRDQMRLFNEAEAIADGEVDDEDGESDSVEIAAHRRKRGGRKPLPPELPRIEVAYELAEGERICEHDGARLKVIGEVVTEQLDIIPAKVQVIRHIRKKYACPCCEETIKTASMPAQPIPKSMVSPGLLAYIISNKFVDCSNKLRTCYNKKR